MNGVDFLAGAKGAADQRGFTSGREVDQGIAARQERPQSPSAIKAVADQSGGQAAARLKAVALVRETRLGDINRMTYELDRRRLLRRGLAVAATALAGCRWESDSASPLGAPPSDGTVAAPTPSPPPAPADWTPTIPAMVVGSGASFDLASTLPVGAKRGGTFGIDPTGARLPVGMDLSAPGILSVGRANIGSVAGVIFTYEV